jgi:CubicO group peptidase (beta-lactamase class C family)
MFRSAIGNLENMRFRSAALILLLSAVQFAQADDFDKKIEAWLVARKVPGCAIAYSEGGKLKFAKGYGFANLEHKVRMRPEHVHELASVSKQFTATCILKLMEAGKLSLDDPISKYFEGAHADWSKVKIRHLLQHTGGLADYLEIFANPGVPVTNTSLINSIKDKPLRFEPGSKWEYSNSGYMVLGIIVSKASGKPSGEYLVDNVFKPTGMKTAVLNDTRSIVPHRADGYSIQNGKIVKEGFTSTSLSQTGDGQVMASALDLIAWDIALSSNKILKKETQAMMNQPSAASAKTQNRAQTGYGFGVTIFRKDGKLVQSHNGGWMGTMTHLTRYIDERKCLVVLCNSDSAPMNELLQLVRAKFALK